MLKTVLASVISIMLIMTPAAGFAAGELDTEAIDTYIEREMRISRIPGLALGIVRDGEIIYLKGYGRAERGDPVTAQTPFIIGSLSKSFTAVAAMQLVEEGKLDLDAPVTQYLPWFTMADDYDAGRITVRHLLVQTSGIDTMAGVTVLAQDGALSLEQEVRALGTEPLVHPPGEAYIYSNSNYLILGLIIETIIEEGYSAHVQDNILQPLEMENSFLTRVDAEKEGMATGHVRWLGFSLPSEVQHLHNALAAGFIISSAEDMGRYLLMHIQDGNYEGKELLSQAGAEALRKPGEVKDGTSEYAMGLVARNINSSSLILHDGGAQGFNSGMAFSPEEGWGVVVLTNAGGLIELPAMDITLGVAEFVRGNTPEPGSRAPLFIYASLLILILALLLMAGRSIVLLPQKWPAKLETLKVKSFWARLTGVVLPVGLELLIPFFVFIFFPGGAGFPVWSLFALFHPDLVYGLFAFSILMLVKAVWRIYLAFRILRAAKS